jgi:hypothetical protein
MISIVLFEIALRSIASACLAGQNKAALTGRYPIKPEARFSAYVDRPAQCVVAMVNAAVPLFHNGVIPPP